MSLKNKSATIGKWLFRWRSYLPLIFIAVIIPALLNYSYLFDSHVYDLIWGMFCFAISLFGLWIRCYTIGYTPKGTSGRNTKKQRADSLNTTGIYSITRNPLYLGNFFIVLGITMLLRVWWIYILYVLVFWLYYGRIIQIEESYLSNKYGKIFKDYVHRTPVFIPHLRLWQPTVLSFSFKKALKREYPSLFGIISAFTVLECAKDSAVKGSVVIDPVWMVIFSFGLLAYITLRILKKKTRLLRVKRQQVNP